MATLFFGLVLLIGLILLRSLIRMRPGDFADADTVLALERYFTGHLRGWGVLEDRFGRVRRQFQIESSGQVYGDTLQIDQTITFDDGRTHHRVWSFQRRPDGRYIGTANDVVGEAVGSRAGNSIRLNYTVRRRVLGLTQRAQVEDWMFLQPGGVVVQRAQVMKWGFLVGRISAFYLADS